MIKVEEILAELSSFTGTENYFKHQFGILYTDGVKYLAETCGAYWLIDVVGSYQCEQKVKNEPFQVFKLQFHDDHSAKLEISNGNGNILASQELEYTDFPLKEIVLWCIDNVVILPSEY
ncbi:MAG: hypothetical protein NT007_00425 [Candidatus Kapabacteria bacterium]|nr:hypothetical protein [Candidatus Kapabacteria bacterium]